MTGSGAGRHRRLADARKTAVAEAEYLDFVDAEISRSDKVAGRVEDDAVRMGRLLALLVRAAAGILDHAAHGAELSIDLDWQDDKIAADIVGDNQVVPGRIHRQMGRDGAM